MIAFFVVLELDGRHVSKREAATLEGVLKLMCDWILGSIKLGLANQK